MKSNLNSAAFRLSLIFLLLFSFPTNAQFFGLSFKRKNLPAAPNVTASVKNISRETNDPVPEFWPRVSPDGTSIAYHVLDGKVTFLGGFLGAVFNISRKEARLSIMKKVINSPARNPIVSDAITPSWTPDGKGILFSYTSPTKPVIVKTSLNGVGLNYISPNAMGDWDRSPQILKDGSRIFFVTTISKENSIVSVDAKGMNFTVHTKGGYFNLHPDGKKLIYHKKVGDFLQIFENDLETGQTTQLSGGDYNNHEPAYSVDGKWIAFASTRGDKQEDPHIYVMKADGSDLKQLTNGFTEEGHPCWAPNGDIFFYSNADRNWDIWKVTPILEQN